MKTRMIASMVVLGLVCTLGHSNASAKSIAVNYYHGGTGGPLLATDVAGVVTQDNWNNVDQSVNTGAAPAGGGTETVVAALVDDNGAATGVSISAHGSGPNGAEAVGGATPDDVMMSGGFRSSILGHGNDPTRGQVQLTNLAAEFAGGYDVYVYFGEGHSLMGGAGNLIYGNSGYTSANGTDTPAGTLLGYNTPVNDGQSYPAYDISTGTGDNGNYQLISGLTDDTLVLTVAPNANTNNDNGGGFFDTHTILGVQIVGLETTAPAASTPEPTSLLLCLLGLVGLGLTRRPRRKRS